MEAIFDTWGWHRQEGVRMNIGSCGSLASPCQRERLASCQEAELRWGEREDAEGRMDREVGDLGGWVYRLRCG